LGGVYFGAMQRFKLDKHIIQCCEQGKHDNFFKSGQRRELDLIKWKDQIKDHDADMVKLRERNAIKRKQAIEAKKLVKWKSVSKESLAEEGRERIEWVKNEGLKRHIETACIKFLEEQEGVMPRAIPTEIQVEPAQLVDWDADFNANAVNVVQLADPRNPLSYVHFRGKAQKAEVSDDEAADEEEIAEPAMISKARAEIQKAHEDEHVRAGLNLLLEALRYHKKKPAGVAAVFDRLAPCVCDLSFEARVRKQDENQKVQADRQEAIEESQHAVREAVRQMEEQAAGAVFLPRLYDKLQGPTQKHERKMLKVNRFRSMTVKELYTEHQMIGTYLVEERQFVKNMLQVSHAVPLVRLMMFGWRTDIDPIDFAGILNANALYSFTLGFAQLGFSTYFLMTLEDRIGCPDVGSSGGYGGVAAAVGANLTGAPSMPPSMPPMPPSMPPMPPMPLTPECDAPSLLLGPLISIFVSIVSFILSFCNICLDFARRLHMQEIERLEKEEAFEQVQMELANFKTTTKEQREKQKEESIKEYKPNRKGGAALDNPFKLTRDLMLIEASYDAADLTYQSYASMRRQDLQSANGDLDKMEAMKNATFGHATKAIGELAQQEETWTDISTPGYKPKASRTPGIAAKAAKARSSGLSA